MSAPDTIPNRPGDTLTPGDKAGIEHRVSAGDMRGFTTIAADITGHGIDRALASDPDIRTAAAEGADTARQTALAAMAPNRFCGKPTT